MLPVLTRFNCSQMEWAILPSLSSRSASPYSGRHSFPVPQRTGGGVGLGGWLHAKVVMCARIRSSIPVSSDRQCCGRAGDQLMTIESQVRCPNHYTTEPPLRLCFGAQAQDGVTSEKKAD